MALPLAGSHAANPASSFGTTDSQAHSAGKLILTWVRTLNTLVPMKTLACTKSMSVCPSLTSIHHLSFVSQGQAESMWVVRQHRAWHPGSAWELSRGIFEAEILWPSTLSKESCSGQRRLPRRNRAFPAPGSIECFEELKAGCSEMVKLLILGRDKIRNVTHGWCGRWIDGENTRGKKSLLRGLCMQGEAPATGWWEEFKAPGQRGPLNRDWHF